MSFHATRIILQNVPLTSERTRTRWLDLRLHGMNGMRTASRDFIGFLGGIFTEHMRFKRGKLERCLFVYESNETRVESRGRPSHLC